MKKVTSTITLLLLCLYLSAQVGTLDEGFNNPTGYVINSLNPGDDDWGTAIAVHSDGRVLVAAYKKNDEWFTLVRYLTDGTLDLNFGNNGIAQLRYDADDNATAYAIKILSDNTILAAGNTYNEATGSYDMAMVKLDENGDPITTFGPNGNGWVVTPVGSSYDQAQSLAVQADGKIVLAGFGNMGANNNDFAVARYSSNGILETGVGAFGSGTGKVTTHINADDRAMSVAIQVDGKIVVGGTSNYNITGSNFAIVRYNTDGTLDASPGSFGTGGIVDLDLANGGAGSTDEGYSLALQSDGKIVVTGSSKAVSAANNDVATIRLTTSGTLDVNFNPTGAIVGRASSFTAAGIALVNNHATTNTNDAARSVALQSNGKIVVGGDSDGSTPSYAFLLVRYNSDGTLDNTFDGSSNGNGKIAYEITSGNELGNAITLYNNRIYITGSTVSGNRETLLAAVENDGSPLPLVLSQFYAQKQTNKVVLQWATSSEEGVKQFVIERSSDGKTYKAIGTVAATGNTTLTQKYSYADNSPFMGINNYYRLLMQDADGNFKYSKMLIIKFDGLLTTELKVNPSVVKDILQVQLPDGMKGNIGLQIINMNGRVIRRSNIASDGNALNTTVDVSSLVKGVYILKAIATNKTFSISRFTKQ